MVLARFRTDQSVPGRGFKIRYSVDICGGEHHIANGIGRISSPQGRGGVNNYPNNMNCEWLLVGPVGHILQVKNLDRVLLI